MMIQTDARRDLARSAAGLAGPGAEEPAHVLSPPSDVLTSHQLAFIAERLREPPCAPRSRRPYSNQELLPGILRVLRSGCRWRDLGRPVRPSGVTHWHRLRFWHRWRGPSPGTACAAHLCCPGQAPRSVAGQPRRHPQPSQEFTEQTGYSGKHHAMGTKLLLLADRAGTPIAISVAPGNYHSGPLRFLTVINIYKRPAI